MISHNLELPLAVLLIIILSFNLTQRKRAGCETKRMASLYSVLPVLIAYGGVLLIKRRGLSDFALFPAAALSVVSFLLLRKRILVFKRKCPACGNLFPLKDVLYKDEPSCPACGRIDKSGATMVPDQKEPSETHPVSITEPLSADKVDWGRHHFTEEAVLCYIVHEGRVLLMHKKTGLGKGKINAPGGRIEPGETPLQAAIRETEEEVGLTPKRLEKRIDLHFIFTDGYSLRGYVFFAEDYSGEPRETDEADPFWCPLPEIPYDKMWADDAVWLPRALKGEHLKGFFIFDKDTMKSYKLE